VDDHFTDYVSARYAHLLRVAALILGNDRGAAEDLVQDALARVYSRSRVADIDNLDAVVRRTMTNLAISRARSASVRRRLQPRLYERPDDRAGAAEEHDVIWTAIKRLPVRQRAVLVLHYFEDLDYSAIAELMNISAGTARSQCLRARAALREALPTTVGAHP
jgi:RNA polymerase sigma-70 factor (sigma-E family)